MSWINPIKGATPVPLQINNNFVGVKSGFGAISKLNFELMF